MAICRFLTNNELELEVLVELMSLCVEHVFNTDRNTEYSWKKVRAKLAGIRPSVCIDIIMKFQLCLTSAQLELACHRSINITSKLKLLVSRSPLIGEG